MEIGWASVFCFLPFKITDGSRGRAEKPYISIGFGIIFGPGFSVGSIAQSPRYADSRSDFNVDDRAHLLQIEKSVSNNSMDSKMDSILNIEVEHSSLLFFAKIWVGQK